MQMIDSAKQRDDGIAAARSEMEAQKAEFKDLEEKLDTIQSGSVKAFGAFPGLKKRLVAASDPSGISPDENPDPQVMVDTCKRLGKVYKGIKRNALLGLYRFFPIWLQLVVIICLGAVLYFAGPNLEGFDLKPDQVAIGTLAAAGFAVLMYVTVLGVVSGSARKLAKGFRRANKAKLGITDSSNRSSTQKPGAQCPAQAGGRRLSCGIEVERRRRGEQTSPRAGTGRPEGAAN